MPILDVEIVMRPDEVLPESLATSIAHRVGEALRSPAGHTWVKLRLLSSENYAENSGGSGERVHGNVEPAEVGDGLLHHPGYIGRI